MSIDSEIKSKVEQELEWDVRLDASDIGVSVRDHVVALSGYVHAYKEKLLAERDAKLVAGVHGVANNIEVRTDNRLDMEIARDASAAIAAQLPRSSEHIQVIVQHGKVRLEGQVEWNYQRRSAYHALDHVRGVRAVENALRLTPKVAPADVKSRIRAALERSALVEAERIAVDARGAEVVLSGKARTWQERDEVELAAWMVPGVDRVDNQIRVSS